MKRTQWVFLSLAILLIPQGGLADHIPGMRTSKEADPVIGRSSFEERVCERVLRRFGGDQRMFFRINQRLEKRFGFYCEQDEPEGTSKAPSDVTQENDTEPGMTLSASISHAFGDVIPAGAQNVHMLRLDIQASCKSALSIDGFTVTDLGVGGPEDLLGAWLRADNVRVSRLKHFDSDKTVELRFRRPLALAACERKDIDIMADFSASARTSARHSFVLLSPTDIASSAAEVAGVFPLQGDVFEVSSEKTGLLTLEYDQVGLDALIDGTDREVIGAFRITADGVEDQTLYSITLENAGSAQDGDFVGIYVRAAYSRTPYTTYASQTENDLITLQFDPPFTLTKGSTVSFEVAANIVDEPDRTIRMQLQEPSDLYGVGFRSGYGEEGQLFGSQVLILGTASTVRIRE